MPDHNALLDQMVDIYETTTPYGPVRAIFDGDVEIPGVAFDPPDSAAAHYMREIIGRATGPDGIGLSERTLLQDDYFGFCQPQGSGVTIEQPWYLREEAVDEEVALDASAASDPPSVALAAARAATSPANALPEPTEAQKEAGNYPKGHVTLDGLEIAIENPAGSRRRPEWPPLAHTYGYFKGSLGRDKDHVDVFLGPEAEQPSQYYVVDQIDPKTGRFDEHKVMMGFASEGAARDAYLSNYEPGWAGLGAITAMPPDEFKAFIRDKERTARPAASGRQVLDAVGGGGVHSLQALRERLGETVDIMERLEIAREILAVRESIKNTNPVGDATDTSGESDVEPRAAHPVDGRDLSDPETYTNDPALAALARRLASEHFDNLGRGRVGLGDLKREFLAGKHAALVDAALQMSAGATKQNTTDPEAAKQLIAPPGYALAVDGETISIKGPFNEDLHGRLKRAGGQWDRAIPGWRIDASKAPTLKRVFANFAKTAPSAEQIELAERKKRRSVIERWLGYIEEKAAQGYLYERGIQTVRAYKIEEHPDLLERLNAAVLKVDQIRNARAKASAERAAQETAMGRIYLNVPYEERETAKRAGAKFDPTVKRWYVIGKTVPEPLKSFEGEPEPKLRRLYPKGRLPQLNRPVRLGSKAVVFTGFGRDVRISEDDPSVHGAHLLGHEGERGAFAYYRPATDQETALLERQEQDEAAERQAIKDRSERLDRLRDRFMSDGSRPAERQVVEGEVLLDTRNIYGGGEWWVIQPDAIWFIRNNGADGDDWDLNNVVTGGAGAIGWRLPRTPEMEAELRELAGR